MASEQVRFPRAGLTCVGLFLVVLGAAMAWSTYPRPLAGPFLVRGDTLLLPMETGTRLPTSWYLWPALSGLGGYLLAVVVTATALHAREQRRERRRADA